MVFTGIYAFPEKFASYKDVSGQCLSNGRKQYVKDENGKKVMMSKKEFHALEKTQRTRGPWDDYSVIVSPKYLCGMYTEDLYLNCDRFNYDDNEMDYSEAYNAWLDDEKRYPSSKLSIQQGRELWQQVHHHYWHRDRYIV